MSGGRTQTPGWERRHRNSAPTGSQQPSFGQSQSPSQAGSRSAQPPVGTGRPNFAFAEGTPPSFPSLSQRDLPKMASGKSTSSMPQDGSPLAAATGRRPTSAYAGSSLHRQSTEEASSFEMGREVGREVGRLESEVERLKKEARFFEAEARRYRAERNLARGHLTQAQGEIAHLTGQIHALQAHLFNAQDPQGQYHTPAFGRAVRSRGADRRSASSNASMIPGQVQSPGIFSRRPMLAITQGPASADASESTPTIPAALTIRPKFGEELSALFGKFEEWAAQYATADVQGQALIDVPGAYQLNRVCKDLCKDRAYDDMIQNLALRKHLIVAIINHHFLVYFGPGMLTNMDLLAKNNELLQLTTDLQRVAPQNPNQRRTILGRRTDILNVFTNTAEFEIQLDQTAKKVADEVLNILEVLILSRDRNNASRSFRALIREGLTGCHCMLMMPCEWIIVTAERGDRWDPRCMVQKNELMHQDPRLVTSNGYGYVVRLGISPSVTEKDYSFGSLRVKEIHQKTVILKENANQKPTPLPTPSGDRRPQGTGQWSV